MKDCKNNGKPLGASCRPTSTIQLHPNKLTGLPGVAPDIPRSQDGAPRLPCALTGLPRAAPSAHGGDSHMWKIQKNQRFFNSFPSGPGSSLEQCEDHRGASEDPQRTLPRGWKPPRGRPEDHPSVSEKTPRPPGDLRGASQGPPVHFRRSPMHSKRSKSENRNR